MQLTKKKMSRRVVLSSMYLLVLSIGVVVMNAISGGYDTKHPDRVLEVLYLTAANCLMHVPYVRIERGRLSLNAIVTQLSLLKLAVYAPLSYVLPSRISKYEALYDTEVEGGKGRLRQADRERSLQALMTTAMTTAPRRRTPPRVERIGSIPLIAR